MADGGAKRPRAPFGQRAQLSAGADSLARFGPLRPFLHQRSYVFATVDSLVSAAELGAVATIVEDRLVSIVVPQEAAEEAGLEGEFECSWITLETETDLDLVGLTAAISARLAEAGIACNVIAGARHDHLFVPVDRGAEVLTLLAEGD